MSMHATSPLRGTALSREQGRNGPWIPRYGFPESGSANLLRKGLRGRTTSSTSTWAFRNTVAQTANVVTSKSTVSSTALAATQSSFTQVIFLTWPSWLSCGRKPCKVVSTLGSCIWPRRPSQCWAPRPCPGGSCTGDECRRDTQSKVQESRRQDDAESV